MEQLSLLELFARPRPERRKKVPSARPTAALERLAAAYLRPLRKLRWLCPRRVKVVFNSRLRSTLGETVTHELLQSQIEIVSPVFDDPRAAATAMHELRRTTGRIAAENGLAIVAAGTHPLAMWMSQAPTCRPRYDRLIEDFGIVGRRNAVCGMHVHVAVPSQVDRIDLMNRTMRWLPLFLASWILSAINAAEIFAFVAACIGEVRVVMERSPVPAQINSAN